MKVKFVFVIFIIVLFSEYLFGQISVPHLGSTRSMSMGGVYTATNTGIDALVGNPGGLALVTKAQLSVGGRLILLGTSSLEEDYYKDVNNYKTYSNKFGVNPKLLNAGLLVPIKVANFSNKLVGAISYRTFYDISDKEITETKDALDNRTEETDIYHGLINVLSLGIGTNIRDVLALGISFNVPILSGYKFEGETVEKTNYATTKTENETEFDVTGGSFLQFGGIIQINSQLSVGASYLTSHKFKLKKGKSIEKEDGQIKYETELPDERWAFPAYYNLGIAYRLAPDLLIAAEYQNRPWEDVKHDGDELYYLESGGSYRLGVEYGTDLVFRTGFVVERQSELDIDLEPVNFNGITAGMGYKTTDFILDLGGVFYFKSFDELKASDRYYEFHFRQLTLFASLIYSLDFSL